MAWATNKGNGRYYQRSRRVDGRVVTEYLGCSPAAQALAESDRIERERLRAKLKEADELERLVAEFDRRVDSIVKDSLTKAGYHRHHGGEWRRKRNERGTSSSNKLERDR